MKAIVKFVSLALLFALAPLRIHAAPVEGAPPILTFKKKDGTQINLSMSDVESLSKATFKTKTPWHDGVVTFEGVPMRALLDHAGFSGKQVAVEALNGYRAGFPSADAAERPVMLAYKRDGNYMPVRDKGPLFIIYNYDSNPELQTERFYSRSVWQVRTLIEE